MPVLSTTDHAMLDAYWRIRAHNKHGAEKADIELVDAAAYPFSLAYKLINGRLDPLRTSVNDWHLPWQPMVNIVDDDKAAFAYAFKGSSSIDWIFLSSKLVKDLHWYAGNIGIKCALGLAQPGPPSADLVAACENTVFEATLGYYLEHELAHHLDGHLGWERTVPLSTAAWQALELAADTIAFDKLINAELARMEQNSTGPATALGAIFASNLAFLAVLPPMRNKNNPALAFNRKRHPNSAFRQLVGLSMWTHALSDAIGSDATELVLQGTQVVICAFLERSGKPDRDLAESWRAMLNKRERLPFLRDADLRKVLYDPHIQAYGNALADRYDQLFPALAPHRRGPTHTVSANWRFR